MVMQPKLDLIGIVVKDMPKALAFYRAWISSRRWLERG
jgi:catechol 2,3-dioxygenase-like lactoylglutathione lyase family enzyme